MCAVTKTYIEDGAAAKGKVVAPVIVVVAVPGTLTSTDPG
jgi:hypothetical protein